MAMDTHISLVFVVLLFMSHGYTILTIQGRRLPLTTGGDDFECVDNYNQSAFDNPLLKDHKIQVKPTFIPEAETSTQSSSQHDGLNLRFKHVGCPHGSVPILRARKRNFLTSQFGSVHPSAQDQWQQHYSVVSVTGEYYGAQAEMNVLKPSVTQSQMSLAVIRVEANNNNMIQAGWAVAPEIYEDFEPHLTIYFRGESLDCYNFLCPGFIQVDNNVPVGVKLMPSVKDVQQKRLQLLIHQDKNTKNWWLSSPHSNVNIGYWHATLFSKLNMSASLAVFGGFVTSSPQEASPAMGYGTFPEGNYLRSGYFMDMQIVDGNGQNLGMGDSWVENVGVGIYE